MKLPLVENLISHTFLQLTLFTVIACVSAALNAQTDNAPEKFNQQDKFRQLEEILPTPNANRTGSGAPGNGYWQQKVDYEIQVRLDDEKQKLFGSESISYTNNSNDKLTYLWLQLDANIHRPNSDANLIATTSEFDRLGFRSLKTMLAKEVFDGGFKITRCLDSSTKQKLKHTIVKTMMRVDLPRPLDPGQTFEFEIDWHYQINNARVIRGRSGCEYFEEDKNWIYEVAQWFPRLCAYTDNTGWQHKQFLGRGEFTLEMGDYVVQITAPNDHIVASTGTLLNPDQVLTEVQRERLKAAKTSTAPVFIVTPDEAKSNESNKPDGTKTWIFKADQVRDFAFASSRKFIWDAMQHNQGKFPVMAMSFYPNEGEPLWSKYSTHAIIHTLEVYSRYTFEYPYPVAISVNGPVGGMEYPMICFNGPRPEKDGTYSASTKYGLISVIIHEVGHNYFPMIVNTDERQWTWMDEGLNTFLQYLAEQEWEDDYPSRRGEPNDIVGYMRSPFQVPIMTNSESILQFGPNGYSKPATALNILRETILGRELFDYAFKEYALRWKFKRPMPADFFRTMEDASGIDLDWFWRGWFYSTDHVDMAITEVRQLNIDTKNPRIENGIKRKARDAQPLTQSKERNENLEKRTYRYPDLKDFYNNYDELDVTPEDRQNYERFIKSLTDEEKKMLASKRHFYILTFENRGGLVMPIIFDAEFEDGTKQHVRIPAEIWKKDNQKVSRLLMTKKVIKSVTLDPRLETADTSLENNYFPPRILKSRFELYKDSRRRGGGSNPMKTAQDREAKKKEASKVKQGKK
ncbi:MAG: M1 family metallopeptidase [Mariniblastus sp.]|nr:M1 family metallopeptidase [Mariniblastus sp.]